MSSEQSAPNPPAPNPQYHARHFVHPDRRRSIAIVDEELLYGLVHAAKELEGNPFAPLGPISRHALELARQCCLVETKHPVCDEVAAHPSGFDPAWTQCTTAPAAEPARDPVYELRKELLRVATMAVLSGQFERAECAVRTYVSLRAG